MDPNTNAAAGSAAGQHTPPNPRRGSSGPRVVLFRAGSSDSMLHDSSTEAGVVVFNPNASASTFLVSNPRLDPWRVDITMPHTLAEEEEEDGIPVSTLQHVPRPKVQFGSLPTVDESNDDVPPNVSVTPANPSQEYPSAMSTLQPTPTTQPFVLGSSTSTVTRFKSSPQQSRATVFSSTSVASAFSFRSFSMQRPPKPVAEVGSPLIMRRQSLHPNTKYPQPPEPSPRTSHDEGLSASLTFTVPLQQSLFSTEQMPSDTSDQLLLLEMGDTRPAGGSSSGLGTHYCDSETADPMPNSTPWER
ncbi:hypothetical protein BC828DRAFT_410128, partial [Blastocladiella britannica]